MRWVKQQMNEGRLNIKERESFRRNTQEQCGNRPGGRCFSVQHVLSWAARKEPART